jgi:UDP:flavonoid glycosyltransferase YjiC (YdhE family)
MRVLFTCRPFIGHLYPMLPLARALLLDGHEVRFATTARFLPEVARLAVPAVPAGADPCRPSRSDDTAAPGYGVEMIRSKVEDIVSWAAAAPIDLVVREPTDFSGVYAAEVLGVPHVTLGRSQFLPAAHWGGLVGRTLEILRHDLGLPADPDLTGLFGSCYLDMVPSWFQPPGQPLPANRVELRPEQFDDPGGGSYAEWKPKTSTGIYVTFGTVYNRAVAVIRKTVAAVSGLGRDVLCTVGADQDPADVVPGCACDDVTIERYLPQSAVLPRCSLVVCHGGYSTVMGAICAGVPMVLIPRGSDHYANAEQCERLGVGITVPPQDFSLDAVRAASQRVLSDPSFAVSSRTLAQRASSAASVRFGARLLNRVPTLHRARLDVAGRTLLSA